jgi:hypothetical protein
VGDDTAAAGNIGRHALERVVSAVLVGEHRSLVERDRGVLLWRRLIVRGRIFIRRRRVLVGWRRLVLGRRWHVRWRWDFWWWRNLRWRRLLRWWVERWLGVGLRVQQLLPLRHARHDG